MRKSDANIELNYDFFSDIEIDLSENFETRYISPPRTKLVEDDCAVYDNAEKLAQQIDIQPGSRHYVFINGSFIAGDFIEALVVEKNYHVKKMTISTLSLSENNIDSLANLLDGGFVDELNLIVSDYFFAHERHNLVKYIYEELDKENKFQLAVAGTHCKICIFETHCGKKITIHGSANLRSSGNIEQLEIEEGSMLYDFNNKVQDSIIDTYKTINKSIRRKKLWDAVKQGNTLWHQDQTLMQE